MGDLREVEADYQGNSGFIGIDKKGLTVSIGSKDAEFSPMELILLGLAGCTALDVVQILRKKRIAFSEFKVKARGLRRDDHPRVYTEIEIAYNFVGDNLDKKAIEQAVVLSQEKYCSVSAMLRESAKITSRIQILPEKTDAG